MVGTGSEGFVVGLAAVTVVRGGMVKGGVARALVPGEEAVRVGSSCFSRASSASDPSVPVMIEVVARGVQCRGGILHYCPTVWCWGGGVSVACECGKYSRQ